MSAQEMTAQQLIKVAAADIDSKWNQGESFESAQEALDFFESKEDEDYGYYFQDSLSEIREGQIETEIRPESSRNYETKSVASNIFGVWVGWTYFYGGGKHGDPDAAHDWVNNAYILDIVSEKEVVIVTREFKKREKAA